METVKQDIIILSALNRIIDITNLDTLAESIRELKEDIQNRLSDRDRDRVYSYIKSSKG